MLARGPSLNHLGTLYTSFTLLASVLLLEPIGAPYPSPSTNSCLHLSYC